MILFFKGIELSFFSGVYSACISFTLRFEDAKRLVGLSGIFIGCGEILGNVETSFLFKNKVLSSKFFYRRCRLWNIREENHKIWSWSNHHIRLHRSYGLLLSYFPQSAISFPSRRHSWPIILWKWNAKVYILILKEMEVTLIVIFYLQWICGHVVQFHVRVWRCLFQYSNLFHFGICVFW